MAALSDMFAVASSGTYPTPTPTDAQRAAFAVSYGLLSVLASADEEGVSTRWFWGFIGPT